MSRLGIRALAAFTQSALGFSLCARMLGVRQTGNSFGHVRYPALRARGSAEPNKPGEWN